MNKLILAILILLSLSGCYINELTPLSTNKYKPNPVAINKVPGLFKDQAWDRAVRLFAERNISIKMIDKGSGFIQSDVISFVSAFQPSYLSGYLKIFILNDSSQAEIRVSIEDLRNTTRVSRYYSPSNNCQSNCGVVSTGRLESEVADYISTGKDSTNIIRIQNGEVLNPHYPRFVIVH
jgi:uncharacterized lipoprotein